MRAPISALGTTGVCDRCGASIAVSAENSHQLSSAETDAPHDPASPPQNASACARCGNVFRGDWDRHTTHQGVLCHICVNRAHEGADGIAIAQAQRLAESATPPSPRIAPTAEPKPHFLKNEKTRGLLILGGVAVVTITLGLIFPVDQYIANFFASSSTELPETSSLGLRITMTVVAFFLTILGYFVRIYVGLMICDKLLNDELYLNLIQVGGTALLFYLAEFANILPYFGFIIVFFLQFWLIWHTYDVEFEKLLYFIFIYIVGGILLSPLLNGVTQLIYAMVGKIFL